MSRMNPLFTAWMQRNARRRFEHIRPHLRGDSLLDIGAAEGWIGACAAERAGMRVELVDVISLNQTDLPFRVYDGQRLPFSSDAFDTVTLLLTLHHCASPETVLAEAVRVARRRLILTESVYHNRLGLRLLRALDGGFNNRRSASTMAPALHFKTVSQWRQLLARQFLKLRHEAWLSRGLHWQRLFVLDVAEV